MSEFYVGQKVVCVDAEEHPEWMVSGMVYSLGLDGLTKGAVYTIRDFRKHGYCGTLGVLVAEIIRVPVDTGYSQSRFRSLESKAISIFRAIAANPHIKIKDWQDA